MPNGKKIPLTPEQVRQRVDQVMDRWQSYPNFAGLLDALMEANGLTNSELARQLSQRTNRTVSLTAVRKYHVAEVEPSYAFIEDLLATNVLHLDPRRIQSGNEERPAGDQRIALFTAAGLIEITPGSIRQWNQEVLAGYRRLLESDTKSTRPRWGDLMTKLLSFHLQGGRQALPDITAFSSTDTNNSPAEPSRIANLLRNDRSPSERERGELYHYVGLDDRQIAVLEEGIASGAITLGFSPRKTPFAALMSRILDKIAGQGISQKQLALLCAQQFVPGAAVVSPSDLSAWRLGRQEITLEKLRSLTAGLRQMGPQRLRNPVTDEEISQLVSAAGFASHQLGNTTHDIIARIDDRTEVKPLLLALRTAADLALPVKELLRKAPRLGYTLPKYLTFNLWEYQGKTYPSGQEVQKLLHCYNHFIRRNGFPPLSEAEIAKVVAAAERDYARWQALSHAEKLEQRNHPRQGRSLPDPSFDLSRNGEREGGREV